MKCKIKSKSLGIHKLGKGVYLIVFLIYHLNYDRFYIYPSLRFHCDGVNLTMSLNKTIKRKKK